MVAVDLATPIPCIPGGTAEKWLCAVCGQSGETDCLLEPHMSTNPSDWAEPEVVKAELIALKNRGSS